jgi:protein-S-isoprenylcysteine O-methyltransferase Ste14
MNTAMLSAAEITTGRKGEAMTNRLIELLITLIIILVLLWVVAQLLPLFPIPQPYGAIVLVIVGAAAVIWALRTLKG